MHVMQKHVHNIQTMNIAATYEETAYVLLLATAACGNGVCTKATQNSDRHTDSQRDADGVTALSALWKDF